MIDDNMSAWDRALGELERATELVGSASPGDTAALNSRLCDRFYAVSRIAGLAHSAQHEGVQVPDAVRERIERALEAGAAVEMKFRLMRAGLCAELMEAEQTRAVLQALAPGREVNRSRVDYSG